LAARNLDAGTTEGSADCAAFAKNVSAVPRTKKET
jgi:hypothetical protein